MGKNNRTNDGRHVQLGDVDTVSMPDDFTAPDTGAFCPQYFGRVMDNDDNGGAGSAYIDRDDTY